jgi:uncharacterized membrane protein SirB2
MIELYAQIKWLHVAAVIASGTLFVLRGVAVQTSAVWPMAAPFRYLSYGIDTVLLTAGLALLALLPGATFANGWLTSKLVFLVIYIGLGSYALKRGRTRGSRRICLAAAAMVYIFIITVARSHHPLGGLRGLLARSLT